MGCDLNAARQALRSFAEGQQCSQELARKLATLGAYDSLLPSEEAKWSEESYLLLSLVTIAECGEDLEDHRRRTVRRALTYEAKIGAIKTLRLLPFVVDQDRLCAILEKHERGIIDPRNLASAIEKTSYDNSIKTTLLAGSPTYFQKLRRSLAEDNYDEILSSLRI